jgi:hypothetical protein
MKSREEQLGTAVFALIDRFGTRRAHGDSARHRDHHALSAVEVLALLSLARRLGLHRHRGLLTAAALAMVERGTSHTRHA